MMLRCLLVVFALVLALSSERLSAEPETIRITVDRGEDIGQAFGSLFEVSSEDGTLVIGAGFQNAYNTRYRADRHELQFFVRTENGDRDYHVEELPRPNDQLTGAYLFSQDGVVYSTYGGVKKWHPASESWQDTTTSGGGTNETMRVGAGVLKFGESNVSFNEKVILPAPNMGSYQMFFYANGRLCFYHVNRSDGPYRPWTDDGEGFSKLYACPWKPGDGEVDLSRAVVKTLPIVGETTFAWGVLGERIVTGSNIGGGYRFDDEQWSMMVEPLLGTSYQLYSSVIYRDRLLMGHYPSGRVFEFDGSNIRDIATSLPAPSNVSKSAREAQTTILYAGEIFAGVWPWGELWRFHPHRRRWEVQQRMFEHPEPSTKVTHPYDLENADGKPRNQWGQRVTSLVTNGSHLFVATSAKSPAEWDPKKAPWLVPEKWKSYGKVYRITVPGHLSVPTKWTDGPTTFEFGFADHQLTVHQDGELLGESHIPEAWSAHLHWAADAIQLGEGLHGPFGGASIAAQQVRQP